MAEPKSERKKMILNLLKTSQIGLSISSIADKLGYSRNTVAKYLKLLQDEDEVYDRELGQYSIWLHKDAKLYYEKDKAKGQRFALETYKHFLEYLHSNHPKLNDEGKEIGYYVGKRFNIRELLSPELLEFRINMMDLNNLAKLIMDLLNNTYLSMDSYEWIEPSIVDDPDFPIIILRLKDSIYFETPINFSILAGVLEIQINSLLKNKGFISRLEIIPKVLNNESKIVELQIKINMLE